MSNRNRVPPLLEPYVRLPPEASLTLLTGVLDATPTWLVVRYLDSLLGNGGRLQNTRGGNEDIMDNSNGTEDQEDVAVVLVSWMRDWEFWKTEARRGGGLDLARLAQQKRFAFVDGLTNLFAPAPSDKVAPPPTRSLAPQQQPTARSTVPARGPSTLPIRGPPVRTPAAAPQPLPAHPQTTSPTPAPGTTTLTSPSLPHAAEKITTLVTTLPSASPARKTVLILDSPSALLATTSTPASSLSSFILQLRSLVHSTLLVTEADLPFLSAAAQAAYGGVRGAYGEMAGKVTPVEAEHAAFVVQQAHGARLVISARGLETGVARDVSGVVRVGRGGGWDEEGESEVERDGVVAEMEVLYYVQADGGVRVFERGAGDVG
ncbi:hypothetical protein M8818_005407 [Zalaria obscura]|uniref:Uncharacterized protein n=1 Tax=Zalaria obscura TaxID=2024903 RepID=A0ACC3S8U1_9PEZI